MQQKQGLTLNRRGFLILAGGALAMSAMPWKAAWAAGDGDPTAIFNAIRKANGLPLMATDSKLEQAAKKKIKKFLLKGCEKP